MKSLPLPAGEKQWLLAVFEHHEDCSIQSALSEALPAQRQTAS